MEYRVLGPLQVFAGAARVPLGGPRAAKALAALLLGDGDVVPVGAIVDGLWDGEPPSTAKHQVHKVIGGLRERLPGAIETDGLGYRIRLDDATVDAATFVRRAAAGTIPDLCAALSLWRGPAYAGIDSRAVRVAAAVLDERRLAAVEALTELRLAAGLAAAVALDLPPLVAANPLRERLRGQLMVALYQCGRQADAHAVYAETRAVLADEIGVDPGPDLVRLHGQLLRADPVLDPPAPRAPDTLPYDLPDFTGRDTEVERLLRCVADRPVTVVDGMAGVGKTALAVHAAHRLAAEFPDGRLFCDLHAHTPGARPVDPEAALGGLLQMAGTPLHAIGEGLDRRVAQWRATLAGRRVLVLLDNAASAAQVRPLLPGTATCRVIVTSRRRLGILEGAATVPLDVLPVAEAVRMFGAVAGTARAAAEHHPTQRVVELCGNLPLAIRIAGTRLAQRRRWSVAQLAGRLQAEADRLDELALEDRGVGSAFALSYAHLSPPQQRMFRLLGAHPGREFDAYAAAALAGTDPPRAEALLEELVDARLLGHASPGRYALHDLLREYARRLAPAEGGTPAARLHDYYLAAATRATDLIGREARRFEPAYAHPPAAVPGFADVDAALTWLEAERPALLAVAEAGDGWQLACVLRAYFEHRGHFAGWRATHLRALRAAAADPRGTALIRFNLGALAMWTERHEEGIEHLRAAIAAGGADRELTATALTNLGMLAHLRHRDVEAGGYLRRALAIEHDNPRTRALGWNNLALVEGRLGRSRHAFAYHRRALDLARRTGNPTAERGILLGIGETSLRLGRPAAGPFRRALSMSRDGRFRMQEAIALDGLAHATAEPAYWREALAILTELGVPRAGLVRRHLALPGKRHCELCPAPGRQARGAAMRWHATPRD